jgi:hypothetical protein
MVKVRWTYEWWVVRDIYRLFSSLEEVVGAMVGRGQEEAQQ